MSYTPPLGNAANATWQGSAAYTPPAGDAADGAMFFGLQASGFTGTQFGMPSIVLQASGFSGTQFGSPALFSRGTATGFVGTAFGTPSILYGATGFSSTTFGTPQTTLSWLADGVNLSSGWINVGSEPWVIGAPDEIYFSTPAFSSDAAIVSPPMTVYEGTDFVTFNLLTTPSPNTLYVIVSTASPSAPIEDPDSWTVALNTSTNTTGVDVAFNIPVVPGNQRFKIYVESSANRNVWMTHFGVPVQEYHVSGFSSTQFGIPRGIDLIASGFQASQFGAPSGRQYFRAWHTRPSIQFGTPTTPTNRVGQATGFRSGKVGTPFAFYDPEHETDWITSADGFLATRFGTPTCPNNIAGVADGFRTTRFGRPVLTSFTAASISSTQFGTPTLYGLHVVTGFQSSQFGVPALAYSCFASGFRATQFGTPDLHEGHIAAPVFRTPRWGTPRAKQSGIHQAYGFSRTWFGHPTGEIKIPHETGGIGSTQFGTPSLHQANYALHMWPNTSFGEPLMTRM